MKLRIIGVVSTLAFALLAGPLPSDAQEPGKVYRIGYLGARSADSVAETALREGLRELGYVEGKNLLLESRYAGLIERPLGEVATQLAADLVHLKVELIVTSPTPSVIGAAQRATRTIPIVMPYTVVDPVEAGFIENLERPGGNITGLTNLDSELYKKRLELLKEALPRTSRVAVLWSMDPPKEEMKTVEAAGQGLGINIQSVVLGALRLSSLEDAFSAIRRQRPDGLLVSPSAFIARHQARLIDFSVKARLPTMYSRSHFVDAGGLMSYAANHADLYRRAAIYVDKILKGAKPADLPVERPNKFELFINLKTAKKLGLTIPASVLSQADKVIR